MNASETRKATWLRATALAGATAVLAALAGPAHADFSRTTDPRGDSEQSEGAGDVHALDVGNRPRLVALSLHGNGFENAIYSIDTKPRRPGAEFELSVIHARWVGEDLYYVGDGRHREVCPRVRFFDEDGPGQMRVEVPRRCLALDGTTPRGIRVWARTFDYAELLGDRAPDRGWSGWTPHA